MYQYLDFHLTEKQQAFRERLCRIVKNIPRPMNGNAEGCDTFIERLVREAAEFKIPAMTVPKEYGGGGTDHVSYAAAMIGISKAFAPAGTFLMVHNSLYCSPLAACGDDSQKEAFLLPCTSGEKWGCYAFVDETGNSETAGVKARARRVGEEWIFQGLKGRVQNGFSSSCCLIGAPVEQGEGLVGPCYFVVDLEGISGWRLEDRGEKPGRGCRTGTAALVFDEVRIPERNVLGSPEQGRKQAAEILAGGRVASAAQAVGIGRHVMEMVLKRAKTGWWDEKPLSSSQTLQWKLADISTELDAAELLTFKAASFKDQGRPFAREADMAKLYASKAAVRAAVECSDLFGNPETEEMDAVETLLRDAVRCRASMGTEQEVRLKIAGDLIRYR